MNLLFRASYLGWIKLALTPTLSPRRGRIAVRSPATTMAARGSFGAAAVDRGPTRIHDVAQLFANEIISI
jgi:hypothetical protein